LSDIRLDGFRAVPLGRLAIALAGE